MFERKFVQKDMANIHIYTARKLSDMAGSLEELAKTFDEGMATGRNLSREDGLAALQMAGAMVCGDCNRCNPGQCNERKYIGIILYINDVKYFAPLSSFKEKHERMKNGLDFIKVGNYAVININNMFPVPDREYTYVDIPKVKDPRYRKLLTAEYRIIRKLQDKIRNNAAELYKHKINKGNTTALAKRCNDFLLLEEKCRHFKI